MSSCRSQDPPATARPEPRPVDSATADFPGDSRQDSVQITNRLARSARRPQTWPVGSDAATPDLEALVRARLRSLRQAMGWSLEALGARSSLSPSTISRVETGKRGIGLDVLVPLARALQIDLESLLEAGTDDPDVVIRPVATRQRGVTTWPLSRPTGGTTSVKMRLVPSAGRSEPRVHPGHDWFYVLDGTVRLTLGDREIMVEAGEAAEFSTMTPHAIDAVGAPAELIMIFDHEGRRAHLHTEDV